MCLLNLMTWLLMLYMTVSKIVRTWIKLVLNLIQNITMIEKLIFILSNIKKILLLLFYICSHFTPNQEKNLELFKFIKVSFWCTYFQGVKRKNVLGICLHLLKVGIKYLQLSEILFKRQKERERESYKSS